MAKRKPIRAAANARPVIAMQAPVVFAAKEEDGEKKGPPKFSVVAYTGVAMDIAGYDVPVVVDLVGVTYGNSLKANLDHDSSKRVGHVTDADKADGQLKLIGVASARTAARDEVVGSAEDDYDWQASIEAYPDEIEDIEAGETASANGRTFEGPVCIARTSKLTGFAFVSHGADDNTSVAIAAKAASQKEQKMKLNAEAKAWVAEMLPSLDLDTLTDDEVKNLEADHAGREGKRAKPIAASAMDGMEKKKIEANRRQQIKQLAEEWSDKAIDLERYEDVDAIKTARDEAIKAGTAINDFKHELQIATLMQAPPVVRGSATRGITDSVLEAAICQAGRLPEKDSLGKPYFDDQTLQVAHDRFKGRIGLNEALIVAAESNGYTGRIANRIDAELHNAAFGMTGPRAQIRATGFSTINLPNTFAGVSNKFLRMGWDAVDQTPLRLSNIRSVNDFKEITTVSLTGGMQFQPVGPDGELKHGQLGEETYGNKASTAGIMFAITRVDYRNDDLNALTAVPKRIGRGGMLYLGHIWFTEFLNPSVANFFHSNNANVNTGVADMTVGGLAATEAIFAAQTDPDGNPLMLAPAILFVPPGLKAAAQTLMSSDRLIDGTGTTIQGDNNIWRGRFRVESSPYLANANYSGYSAVAWYMLADPNDMPVIEIAALDGNVTPTVETADADFNVLGVQMRGYSDVGVRMQEPRGGVRADGGSS